MYGMTSYFSMEYMLVFLPVVILLYAVSPLKIRRMVLLISSYLFFWAISGKLIVYLLISTFSVHHFGLWINAIQNDCETALKDAEKGTKKTIRRAYEQRQKQVMFFAVIVHLGMLLTLKYTPFFAININSLLHWLKVKYTISIPSFVLPIGISFYTMQAMSYIFDVYRKKIKADQNFLRLAIFMGFFPQIMEGPICRYSQTAMKLYNAPRIQWNAFLCGTQRILYGIMKKMVVADRLNLFVKNIFEQYQNYDGFVIFVAAVFYTIQLYMDFSGTMDVVIGTAQIFGVDMPENFQRPFFSRTISEFWMRWHITLGAWFKDYIFYPMSMSHPLKKLTTNARKKLGNHYGPLLSGAIAVFCVWICNGLWHGAGWNYIFFGMYHFAWILLGSLLEPIVIRLAGMLRIDRNHFIYKCMQIGRTCLIVCIGELFFRAKGLKAGMEMFHKICTEFTLKTIETKQIVTFGLDKHDVYIVAFVVLIVFIVGILQEKQIYMQKEGKQRSVILQVVTLYSLIFMIIIFGAYGYGYVPVDPMYAAF